MTAVSAVAATSFACFALGVGACAIGFYRTGFAALIVAVAVMMFGGHS